MQGFKLLHPILQFFLLPENLKSDRGKVPFQVPASVPDIPSHFSVQSGEILIKGVRQSNIVAAFFLGIIEIQSFL
jgi:hypothetical protein